MARTAANTLKNTNSRPQPARKVPVASTAVTAKADIDDIFAKPSASAAPKAPDAPSTANSTDASTDAKKSEKKKKKKQSKSESSAETIVSGQTPSTTEPTKKSKRKAEDDPSSANDAPVSEVAVFSDPSVTALSSTKKQKTTAEKVAKSREQIVKDDEEERAFRDSRGDGPREYLAPYGFITYWFRYSSRLYWSFVIYWILALDDLLLSFGILFLSSKQRFLAYRLPLPRY
ncbi:hypothetical protein QFC19_008783 [Naganishia cerealis]|uniref:Uncharacterized protein n=1 Tax=Naganishia cerealis TaxID=610337 RepID=A0ACC2V0K5_9TREE|nr:hypothetical protein QFC19_008783 [Naganishia cerealis]